MKTSLKAAVAAIVMVAGAQQAQAVRWVEYTVTGWGIVSTVRSNYFDPETVTYEQARFIAKFTVDADTGSGNIPGGGYSSDGYIYNAQFARDGIVRENATFDEASINGSSSYSTTRYWSSFSAAFSPSLNGGRAMAYSSVYAPAIGYGSRVSGNATSYDLKIADVAEWQSFSMQLVSLGPVPEPATWGMMLLGFGMVGAGLRSRRRSTTVTFA